jgi:serine/threonine protein kinase
MKDCNSPHIVTFYGAFLNDSGDVIMCMEYMDAGYVSRTISKARLTVSDRWIEYQKTLVQFEWMYLEK